MLDFNHRPKLNELITAHIDCALTAEREQQPKRTYLGASRLGVACDRALQFEFAGAPADPGRDFSGRLLRIFEVGHTLEDLAIRWLRLAGLDLHTRTRSGGQFGFSVCDGLIQGHVDGIITAAPDDLGNNSPCSVAAIIFTARSEARCASAASNGTNSNQISCVSLLIAVNSAGF